MYIGGDIVRDGLVLHLDAGSERSYPKSGTVWKDLSGNRNNSTLINGPSFSNQNNGKIVFDGVDDYAQITDNSTINFNSGSFTIECYFKPKTTQSGGNFPAVINKSIGDFTSPSGGVTGWILYWRTSSNFYQFQLGDSSTTVNGINFPSSITNDDIWKCITVVVSTNNIIYGYYNGNEVVSSNRTLTGSTNTNVTLTIGTWRQFGRELNSDISVVRVYNRALSSIEVEKNYNATKKRFGL